MNVYMCVCLYMCVDTKIYVHVCVYEHPSTDMCMYVHVHKLIHICTHLKNKDT